jgi:hypothetical protein
MLTLITTHHETLYRVACRRMRRVGIRARATQWGMYQALLRYGMIEAMRSGCDVEVLLDKWFRQGAWADRRLAA